MITSRERVTPTYIKPMIIEGSEEREVNRIDIKNQYTTPVWIENLIIERLLKLSYEVDAIIVIDQVIETKHGTVTEGICKMLADLGETRRDLIILADSRASVNFFSNILNKCNYHELLKTYCNDSYKDSEEEMISKCGVKILLMNNRPVFVTLGGKVQKLFEGEKRTEIPAVPAEGPFDFCGAGDATTSGIVSALCFSASYSDAALLGNTVASITIQQLGVTGTASPGKVLERFKEFVLYIEDR